MQAAQKLVKQKLTKVTNEALPAITEDIKQYLDRIMKEAAGSDDEVQRVLDIFDNEENPIVFDFVEGSTRVLTGGVDKQILFEISIGMSDVQDLVMSVVPASFIEEYFNGLEIDVQGEIRNIAVKHIQERM